MLQIESVSSRIGIDHSQSSSHDRDPSSTSRVDGGTGGSGSSVVVECTRIPHQRFSFDRYEQELTFTPKLNATSLKLAHERRTQVKSGMVQRAPAPTRVMRLPDSNLHHASSMSPIPKLPGSEFTFKPQMSTASAKIAEGLGTTFMARQELHLQKQRQKLEQSTKLPLRGRLSPVPNIAKTRRLSLKEKEDHNEEASQVAWRTPSSTPNLIDAKEGSPGETASKRPTGGSTPSLLAPVKPGRGGTLMQTSVSFNKLQDSAYGPNTSMSLKRLKGNTKPKHLNHKRGTTYPSEGHSSQLEEDSEQTSPLFPCNHTRSKTNASPELSPRSKARYSISKAPNTDRLRNAKLMAEKAMKMKKIFTIQGPYPVVRASLMRRSWVEKEYRLMNPHKYKKKNGGEADDSESDDDDDMDDDNACNDDNDDAVFTDPNGACGIMSRIVRNATPSFLWTVRKGAVDYKLLRKDTIVNHFCKNGTFTTKVGLCLSLKNLPWFEEREAETFLPRCYRICADEEKEAFVDDYRVSAAIGVLKWIVMKQDGDLNIDLTEEEENKESDKTEENKNITSPRNGKALKVRKIPVVLGTPFVNIAIKIVEDFLASHEHDDIDEDLSPLLTDEQWDKFITEYYQLTSERGSIDDVTMHYVYCESLLNRLRSILPQLDMQGLRNIWIVKPGAKSRGRGIMCMNKLDEILKLVGNPMVKKEGKWIVQKYIERPLLIYQTKFDIRQWFLVTDWNPLTIWWYDACYLRFCTQPFSLDDLAQSIHLSNQSIQKNYDNAVERDENLPYDNMWDSDTFRKYLDDRGFEGLWESVIVPGMKKAIVDSMLCAQDAMEARKNSFELYGADFMLTDDFLPWMLEINASPAMGASTPVTEEMCASVIEDTMKVVLDRRHDKNCDTGKFQVLFKGPSVSVPPYIGSSVSVDGVGVRRPVTMNRQKSINNIISPRPEAERKSDPQRSKTPGGKMDKTSAFQKLGLKTGATPKATTMEDMKKKLAVSPSKPQDLPAAGQHEARNCLSRQSRSSIDGVWSNTCTQCGNGRGYILDTSHQSQVCDCQRGSLVVPDSHLDEPRPSSRPSTSMLRLTMVTTPNPPSQGRSITPRRLSHPNLGVALGVASNPLQTTMFINNDKVFELSSSQNDPLPKAINFLSDSVGQLMTLNDSADLSGVARPGRLGFSQSRTRPNVNRQRRENLAFMKANGELRSPGPMPAVLTNARR